MFGHLKLYIECKSCIFVHCVLEVVTGSTHGIGKAFAQEMASQGLNVIIISLGERECQCLGAFLGREEARVVMISIHACMFC